jgi:hypothetical protein
MDERQAFEQRAPLVEKLANIAPIAICLSESIKPLETVIEWPEKGAEQLLAHQPVADLAARGGLKIAGQQRRCRRGRGALPTKNHTAPARAQNAAHPVLVGFAVAFIQGPRHPLCVRRGMSRPDQRSRNFG